MDIKNEVQNTQPVPVSAPQEHMHMVVEERKTPKFQIGNILKKYLGVVWVEIVNLFTPLGKNSKVTKRVYLLLLLLGVHLYLTFVSSVIPSTEKIFIAIARLWTDFALGKEILMSLLTYGISVSIAMLIALFFSYLLVLNSVRPATTFLTLLRFWGLVGLPYLFGTGLALGGVKLKFAILIFAMTPFFISSMRDHVEQIMKKDYDLARTLRMGKWRMFWRVVVWGTRDKAFDTLEQNSPIAWGTLVYAESYARDFGGIGVLLANENKYLSMDGYFAIQLISIIIGYFACLRLIRSLKFKLCRFSYLQLEGGR